MKYKNEIRRTKEETCVDILGLLLFNNLSMKFTQLMEKANLRHYTLKRVFLPYLSDKGYIKRKNISAEYFITKKGIQYYIDYHKVRGR